jgi:Flp pilus assembly protein CpaB
LAIPAPGRKATDTLTFAARHRRILSRVSGGHVVMIVAGLLGLVLTLAVLRNADTRVRVAVAAHDVRAGSVVDEGDLRYARVKMDDALLDTVLEPDEVARLDEFVATSPIPAGEIVARSDLRPPAARSGLRAVSIPIEPARAVNGDLSAGDRVDVLLANEREVAIIIADAEVLDVSDPARETGFGEVQRDFTLTLAVDARGAQLLAVAITDGDILVARSTGAKSAAGAPALPVDSAVLGGADG